MPFGATKVWLMMRALTIRAPSRISKGGPTRNKALILTCHILCTVFHDSVMQDALSNTRVRLRSTWAKKYRNLAERKPKRWCWHSKGHSILGNR